MNSTVSTSRTHSTARLSGFRLRALVAAMCCCVLATTSSTAAIYKSIDSNGNVVFTDQPLEGAEAIADESTNPTDNYNDEVQPEEDPDAPSGEGVLVAPQPKNPPKSTYTGPEEPPKFLPVTRVEILTPINNATLRNPVGKIWVELQSYPTSIDKTGLTAELWMNDQLIVSAKRPMVSLPTPKQGTHVLSVRLVDDKGRLFLTSAPTQFHVK